MNSAAGQERGIRMMEKARRTLQQSLDRAIPEGAASFYRMLEGSQDPVGEVRRLIAERGVVETCADELGAKHPTLDIGELVIDLLNTVPLLPVPIGADYRPFRNAAPFAPHLVCYALAYIKHRPEPRFIEPFATLIIRTGWWAGDEYCVDDILNALSDNAEVCRVAADSLTKGLSSEAVFAAGQLLYHLRYGEDWNLRDYVKAQYEKVLRILKNPEDLNEIRERLKSGLKPWKTMHP